MKLMQVVETSQVGRFSVSSPPDDMSYKEMASHCEELLKEKQQKMSTFMIAQQSQEISNTFPSNYDRVSPKTWSCILSKTPDICQETVEIFVNGNPKKKLWFFHRISTCKYMNIEPACRVVTWLVGKHSTWTWTQSNL